jgi:hypothetical protein
MLSTLDEHVPLFQGEARNSTAALMAQHADSLITVCTDPDQDFVPEVPLHFLATSIHTQQAHVGLKAMPLLLYTLETRHEVTNMIWQTQIRGNAETVK